LRQIVARFAIAFRRHLGPDGGSVAPQRTGRLGTCASSLGQEAVAVGLAAAMRAEDVPLPSYRGHGAQPWRGVTMTELLRYWDGDERGSDFAGPRPDLPVSVPVGGHAPPPPPPPPPPGLQTALRGLLSRHATQPEPDLVEALTERLAEDAQGALAGLAAPIRQAFEEATDMQDLARRLSLLQLDPRALAEAMGRGLALAHLVGQAALLDELRRG
jgi:hypothetical protein